MGRLDVHDRLLSRPDAVLEVFAVTGALEDLHAAERWLVVLGLLLGICRVAVAVGHGQMAVVSPVDRAVAGIQFLGWLARLGPDQGPVWILKFVGHGHFLRCVVDPAMVRFTCGLHADRTSRVRVHDPLRDAHHMRSAIPDLPAAEVQHPPEASVRPSLVERDAPRWPKPRFVVQARGRLLVRGPVAARILVVPAFDLANGADLAVVDVLLRVEGCLLGAPLRTDLDNASVPLSCRDHRPALFDGFRRRLFDIDVLARLAGHDRHQRVPMIRRGDEDSIDVPLLEHAPEVLVELRLAPDHRCRHVEPS